MWVSPAARGQRLGTRLLAHLEGVAREMGFETVRLDTRGHDLPEAVALYEKSGYEPIERYNDNPHATHFFAKSLGSLA
jgi:ribosomal protein S18 acetylase RimI-like enzyme